MKTMDRLIILLVGILACGTYVWSVKYQPTPQDSETISVQGEGKAKIAPDTLNLSLSITETGATTRQAQQNMADKLLAVKELLSGYNIPDEKIKTENLNVSPEYDWKDGERRLLRQQANQTLNIEISGEGFEAQGSKIISMLPKAGDIRVNSSDFRVSDLNAGVDQARENAFENAKIKAEHLAKLSGKKLGRVLSITDGVANTDQYPVYSRNMMMKSAEDALPIENDALLSAGEQERSHTLHVVFQLD